MRKRYHHVIIMFLACCSSELEAQVNCTVPLPPVLTSVSVQPETDKTEFTWLPSESSDVAAYILYTFKNGDGQAIDTVWDPSATSHVISNNAPKYGSVSYVVAAHRLSLVPGMPGCTSPLSNAISTIFCEASIDTCNRKLHISWNSYTPVPKIVTGYIVMLSVNNGEFSTAASEGADILSFTLDDFITGALYCFYIRAELEDGTHSSSNQACVLTDMQKPPEWINADYATVTENGIALAFTVDPESQITDFLLERKTGQDDEFAVVSQLQSVGNKVVYTDNEADINNVNYYRLSAVNNCQIPVTFSNIASNIVLSLNPEGNYINLSWNPYRYWLGQVSGYRIYVDSGSGYVNLAAADPEDSVLAVDYRDIMYSVTGKEICFYVSASESLNPYGIAGESNSSVKCTPPAEIITVPNIFTPNNDLVNDLFRPVLSFIPTEYHLVISENHGKVLFESRDHNEAWDGSSGGKAQPDGVYLWFLKITTPSGKSLSRSGTVTIIHNP
jgi:gliding motility-associated-like protein